MDKTFGLASLCTLSEQRERERGVVSPARLTSLASALHRAFIFLSQDRTEQVPTKGPSLVPLIGFIFELYEQNFWSSITVHTV